jgi:hypothetical protein
MRSEVASDRFLSRDPQLMSRISHRRFLLREARSGVTPSIEARWSVACELLLVEEG